MLQPIPETPGAAYEHRLGGEANKVSERLALGSWEGVARLLGGLDFLLAGLTDVHVHVLS